MVGRGETGGPGGDVLGIGRAVRRTSLLAAPTDESFCAAMTSADLALFEDLPGRAESEQRSQNDRARVDF